MVLQNKKKALSCCAKQFHLIGIRNNLNDNKNKEIESFKKIKLS